MGREGATRIDLHWSTRDSNTCSQESRLLTTAGTLWLTYWFISSVGQVHFANEIFSILFMPIVLVCRLDIHLEFTASTIMFLLFWDRGLHYNPGLSSCLGFPRTGMTRVHYHTQKNYAFSMKRERNGLSIYCIAPCHQKTQLVGIKEWKRCSCVFLASPKREMYGGVWAYSYKTLLNPLNT